MSSTFFMKEEKEIVSCCDPKSEIRAEQHDYWKEEMKKK